MKKSRYNKITSQFHKRIVLVVGDLMLDKYLWGRTNRISPEAPVQILDIDNTYYTLGGAANVAHNLVKLGSDSKVMLMGAVGDDENGARLIKELKRLNVDTSLVKIVNNRIFPIYIRTITFTY